MTQYEYAILVTPTVGIREMIPCANLLDLELTITEQKRTRKNQPYRLRTFRLTEMDHGGDALEEETRG